MPQTADTANSGHLYAVSSLPGRIALLARERGFGHVLRKIICTIGRMFYARTLLRFRRPRIFEFNGEEYRQYYHPYNFTWDNERAVEVPVVLRILEKARGLRVLEVGNVLSHYVQPWWTVLDKFEQGECVICEDVVDHAPDSPYDLIVTISTLEHVGQDDDVRDPAKAPSAVRHLMENCLAPGGRLVVTIPVGWNPALDRAFFNHELGFTDTRCLGRVDRSTWKELPCESVRDVRYADAFIEAGAVIIADYRDPRPASGRREDA